ncbi:MAG: hypothetical protein Solumvirus4_28 [Solumvirus sp.]|uniref:Uncharacterized protein n=1 Tax=Solumvirus sp. TaxID=2487773 RepID=A0A3G5AGT9_9VIRU|nr:MAG: hypothetical protein Solumvirus4_28 [Solumvirus sp.]
MNELELIGLKFLISQHTPLKVVPALSDIIVDYYNTKYRMLKALCETDRSEETGRFYIYTRLNQHDEYRMRKIIIHNNLRELVRNQKIKDHACTMSLTSVDVDISHIEIVEIHHFIPYDEYDQFYVPTAFSGAKDTSFATT